MSATRQIIVSVVLSVLASLLAVSVFCGSKTGSSVSSKETAYERVLRTKTLRCGYAMWPPLVFDKNPNTGEMTGIARDIIEETGKALHVNVEWVAETGWGDYAEGLKSGRFDVFCATAWQSGAKGREMRYTVPLYYNPVYAYVRADDTRFDDGFDVLNDPSIRISGQDGEISEMIARNDFPKATYVGQPQLSDLSLIFLNIDNGKADIVFNVQDVADAFMSKNPGKLKRVSDMPYMISSASFAVSMRESDLQQMLDSALIELQNNGVINKILLQNKAPRDQFLPVAKPYQLTEKP